MGNDWLSASEFRNKAFTKSLKENNIIPYNVYSQFKAPVAERFITTLMQSLARYMEERNTQKIDNSLADITAKYNNQIHHSMGMRRNDVHKDNQDIVWRQLYEFYFREAKKLRKPPKYSIGQKLRFLTAKLTFYKGE